MIVSSTLESAATSCMIWNVLAGPSEIYGTLHIAVFEKLEKCIYKIQESIDKLGLSWAKHSTY